MSRNAAAVFAMFAVAAMLALALAAGLAVDAAASTPPHRTYGYGQVAFNFAGPERWAMRWRRERRKVVALRRELREVRRVLLSSPRVSEAIGLAATAYGHGPTLWRKARCETGGTFSPRSLNRSSGAAGLFQFLPSTWRSTPFGGFSIWSPYANALAAGWMHAAGRGNEWACR